MLLLFHEPQWPSTYPDIQGMCPQGKATALGTWAHEKPTRRWERVGMVGGKEAMGTEPREVKTGGREPPPPTPSAFPLAP